MGAEAWPAYMGFEEEEARLFLESLRWNGTPVCYKCGSDRALVRGRPYKPGTYRCKDCFCQFRVMSGTRMDAYRATCALVVKALCFYVGAEIKPTAPALNKALEVGSREKARKMWSSIYSAFENAVLDEPLVRGVYIPRALASLGDDKVKAVGNALRFLLASKEVATMDH